MSEPLITIRSAHDSGPGNLPPTRVVIHTAESGSFPGGSAAGKAQAVAKFFATDAAPGSAHYVVDVAGEQHCVPENLIAWHAPPNPHSVGIEIAGTAAYTREQWLSPSAWPAVVRAAARTADLCQRYSIPVVKLSAADLLRGAHGICGHVDVSNAWHQSTHTDPGQFFPWAEFITAVLAQGGDDMFTDADRDLLNRLALRVDIGTARNQILTALGNDSPEMAPTQKPFAATPHADEILVQLAKISTRLDALEVAVKPKAAT